MSAFIRTLNLIKTHRNAAWLTPSQRAANEELRTELRMSGLVNLYGSRGTGKTFLAWILAESLGLLYVSHLSHLSRLIAAPANLVPGVVVDNCWPDRSAHRETRKTLDLAGIHRGVLVSRESVRDYVACVELTIVAADIELVRDTLQTLGVPCVVDARDLWELVNPVLTSPHTRP